MIDQVIASALTLSVPLVLAALGGALHRQAGVVNIGLEGQMVIGALVAALVSGAAHSWVLGVLAGAWAGALVGWLMSLTITRLHANEIIVGLGFNTVVVGVIGYWLRASRGVSGTLQVDGLVRLPTIRVPLVEDVPVLGAVLSGRSPLFWLAVVLVAATTWLLDSTRWGLRVRAVGASPAAGASLGLRTGALQDSAGAAAGLLAGLGGAALSLGAIGLFNENMVAGRGFVAMAAFYFGRARPLPTALACLLFGTFDAVQARLQISGGYSASLIQTLPYVAVVVVLALTGIRSGRRSARAVA
jgi:general nucleoside transport system permease protein